MEPGCSQTSRDAHARPNLFEIDLGAIAQFARNIRGLVGADATIFAALKCDAYGFGLVPVARTVLAAGVDAISVVDRGDAVALREAGIGAPILVYPGAVATEEVTIIRRRGERSALSCSGSLRGLPRSSSPLC